MLVDTVYRRGTPVSAKTESYLKRIRRARVEKCHHNMSAVIGSEKQRVREQIKKLQERLEQLEMADNHLNEMAPVVQSVAERPQGYRLQETFAHQFANAFQNDDLWCTIRTEREKDITE